jgi:cell division protein FtsA
MSGTQQHIAVIDFGSSIARILIVEDTPEARVVAFDYELSEGINHGIIVDLDKASETIRRLLSKLKKQYDQRLLKVFCSISGDSLTSLLSHGVVKIKHREVTQYDLDDLSATAQAIALDNQVVMHMVPQQYKVDNQEGITDPLGMYGVRLEGDFQLILADQGVAQNIIRCLDRVGLMCQGLIFMPTGLADAVLTQDEKQQGVVLVDIGEGTTDFSVFVEGMSVHAGSIPIGGGAVTRDIAYRLQINNQVAESMKLTLGSESEDLDIPDDVLHEVIEARYMQIFKLIERSLIKEGVKQKLSRGYVLCGGGSQYSGIHQVVENVCSRGSRVGALLQETNVNMSHMWLGAVGLVYYVQQQEGQQLININSPLRRGIKVLQRWLEVYF